MYIYALQWIKITNESPCILQNPMILPSPPPSDFPPDLKSRKILSAKQADWCYPVDCLEE